VLTIAVASARNTALFSVFDRLVINPTTIPEPASLVALWVVNKNINFNAPALSWPRYEEIRAHATSFRATAQQRVRQTSTLTDNGEPEQLNGLRVTSGFFSTLGVPLARAASCLHSGGGRAQRDRPSAS